MAHEVTISRTNIGVQDGAGDQAQSGHGTLTGTTSTSTSSIIANGASSLGSISIASWASTPTKIVWFASLTRGGTFQQAYTNAGVALQTTMTGVSGASGSNGGVYDIPLSLMGMPFLMATTDAGTITFTVFTKG